MFFALDKFTGRLASASQRTAYNPQSLLPYQELPVARFEQKSVQPVRGLAGASLKEPLTVTKPGAEVHGVVPDVDGYRKFVDFQRKMMKSDGLLVWQKLPRDRAMYWATVGLCATILGLVGRNVYNMSFGKKK